jgi:hypothetical protein
MLALQNPPQQRCGGQRARRSIIPWARRRRRFLSTTWRSAAALVGARRGRYAQQIRRGVRLGADQRIVYGT